MNQVEGELAAVCQAIAEDGELTGDEVRYLAEWLTANPAARQTPVGCRMSDALNEILADGEINEEELHRLAPLIGEAIACQFTRPPPIPKEELAEGGQSKGGFVAGVKRWLAGRKEKREQEHFARREMERRRILARQAYVEQIIQRLRGGDGFLDSAGTFITKPDESICCIEPGVLHEIRVVSRRYSGGHSGARIRVAKGLSFSVGGSRGEPVSERGVVPTSRGNLIITTKRIAFVGDGKSIAVKLDKLIDAQISLDGIQFSETGRQYPKLVRFNSPNGDLVVAVMNFVLNEGN